MSRLNLEAGEQYFAVVELGSMAVGDTYSFSVGVPLPSDTGAFGVGLNVGPSGGGGGGSGCFIATAAYGTPLEVEIDSLRAIRDARLLTNPMGAAFADAYYRVSPPIAQLVSQHATLRTAVRGGIQLMLHPVWLAGFAAAFVAIAGLTRGARRVRLARGLR
jgi:hypothetical protein